jgi:hypothetical protein
MPASIKRIRESWNIKPTARNKGLTLTLKVTAYDNGMVEVDGIPINVEPQYDQGHGWLGAADVITTTLNEFRKDAAARRKQRQSCGLTKPAAGRPCLVTIKRPEFADVRPQREAAAHAVAFELRDSRHTAATVTVSLRRHSCTGLPDLPRSGSRPQSA